jgi:hypothetical protein
MAAPNGYPSWCYSRTEPAVIVNSLAAFNALGGFWGTTPDAGNPPQRPPIDVPGTPLAAMLAILLLLTQRLPTPPADAALLAAAPEPETEPEPEHERGANGKHRRAKAGE